MSHGSPSVPYGAEQLTALPRPSGTPSSTWGFVFSKIHQLITAAARSWCAAFAAFGYKISGPTLGLWPRSGPHSQQHTWTYIHLVCIFRAICNLFFIKQMLRCLYITLAKSVSEDPQAAPQYVNSMRDNCALSNPPDHLPISTQLCLHRSVIMQNLFNACQIQRIKSQCCISTKPSNSSLQYKIIYIHKAEFTC